jgi:hypothetical protein
MNTGKTASKMARNPQRVKKDPHTSACSYRSLPWLSFVNVASMTRTPWGSCQFEGPASPSAGDHCSHSPSSRSLPCLPSLPLGSFEGNGQSLRLAVDDRRDGAFPWLLRRDGVRVAPGRGREEDRGEVGRDEVEFQRPDLEAEREPALELARDDDLGDLTTAGGPSSRP